MHVLRLDGELLDFWVAKAGGLQLLEVAPAPGERHDASAAHWHPHNFHPSTDWTHAARFLMDEWYALEDCLENWLGPQWSGVGAFRAEPLKWFMRAYVATQFGEVLEDRPLAMPQAMQAPARARSAWF